MIKFAFSCHVYCNSLKGGYKWQVELHADMYTCRIVCTLLTNSITFHKNRQKTDIDDNNSILLFMKRGGREQRGPSSFSYQTNESTEDMIEGILKRMRELPLNLRMCIHRNRITKHHIQAQFICK